MRKIVLFMHVSLDGYVAGPNGEMNWIHVDEEIFEYAGWRTNEADTALYGRKTFEMMESYWPDAGNQPDASKHDVTHSNWYNNVEKLVLSRTLQGQSFSNTTIISDDVVNKVNDAKQKEGKEIIIFGSPSAAHTLMQEDLIDDYWLFINPILIGNGIPLFKGIKERQTLQLVKSHVFSSGVICLHYQKKV